MIAIPAGTDIWVAAGVTDMRQVFTGLSAAAQTVLGHHIREEFACYHGSLRLGVIGVVLATV